MTLQRIKEIFASHGISTISLCSSYSNISDYAKKIWRDIEVSGDPLSEEEHLELFDYFWGWGVPGVPISQDLKKKLAANRRKTGKYYNVLIGSINGSSIVGLTAICGLNQFQEVELWSIFHRLNPQLSGRSFDEIDSMLRFGGFIESKLKIFGKINVLDVGCGPNGYGIATMAAKYPGKINGFGIDLIIKEHPTNVRLVRASADRIPFPNNYFDIIYSCAVIYYFSNKQINHVISEILRVLKRGGFFAFNERDRDWKTYSDSILPNASCKAEIVQKKPIVLFKE